MECSAEFIDTSEHLARLCEELQCENEIAVDLEVGGWVLLPMMWILFPVIWGVIMSAWYVDAGMSELHTEPRHPLRSANPHSYFDLLVVPPGYHPNGNGDCRYLEQYNQPYPGWVISSALVCCQSGTEGNNNSKPTCRRNSLALVGNSPKRRKFSIQTYCDWNLLALSQFARP